MTRKTVMAVLGSLLLTASVTLADALQRLSHADAQRAARALPRGTLFVTWTPDGQPQLKRARKAELVGRDDDRFEVVVRAELLATATRPNSETAWDWTLAEEETLATETLDLAYVFVPSRELEFTYVSLGKKLRLPCEVASIAIELPEQVIRAVVPLPEPARRVMDPRRVGESIPFIDAIPGG